MDSCKLLGPKRIGSLRIIGYLFTEQNGWTLTFVVPKIRPVLRITCQFSKFGRKISRDLWRICQPKVLVRLEPAEAIADHNTAPHVFGRVWSSTMHGRTKKADRITWSAFRDNRITELIEALDRTFMCPGIDAGRAVG